jgi:hypothetical protein
MNSESQKTINEKKLTDKIEIPEGIDIRRDSEEEENRKPYIFYKIYIAGQVEEMGIASYRLYDSNNPYWYIDEFLIAKSYRKKKYGTFLLKYIVQEMWGKKRLPIEINPSGLDIPKEEFIKWLVNRDFQKSPHWNKDIYILYPKDREQT